MMLTRFNLLAIFFMIANLAQAETKVIIFGGGAGPDSSELSIEKNVDWAAKVLRKNGLQNIEILFSAGTEGRWDVLEKHPEKSELAKWLPIARVLSSKTKLLSFYRKNTVATLPQDNTKDNAIKLIEETIKESKDGDDLLIIYLGHGGHTPSNTNKNYLRLWAGTKLDVVELLRAINKQPKNITTRFIFPQCFSGAFVKLLHADTDRFDFENITTQRCGFVTVPDNRRSEGCTVEDDETKYRDFSTYFFAALNDRTRLGQELEWNPDKNADGVVDFREAYFYANIEGYARDVPRTTSEYYLELWEPWYVRWMPFKISEAGNEYKMLASRIAEKLDISPRLGENGFMDAVQSKREDSEKIFRDVSKRRDILKKKEKEIREQLVKEINYRWPQAKNAYTDKYLTFIERDLENLTRWLVSLPDFNNLVELQDKLEQIEEEVLFAERDQGMSMRLQRAIYLSKLRHAFDRLGSKRAVSRYSELVRCESWSLDSNS